MSMIIYEDNIKNNHMKYLWFITLPVLPVVVIYVLFKYLTRRKTSDTSTMTSSVKLVISSCNSLDIQQEYIDTSTNTESLITPQLKPQINPPIATVDTKLKAEVTWNLKQDVPVDQFNTYDPFKEFTKIPISYTPEVKKRRILKKKVTN